MSDYDLDFYAWTQRQGGLLRRLAAGERVNDADLDWPNIAEEIETLGRSERGAVASRIRNVVEHLMKLEASPATEPRAGWRRTIKRERIDIESLLDGNPTLKPVVSQLIASELPRHAAWYWRRLRSTGKHPGSILSRFRTAKNRCWATGCLAEYDNNHTLIDPPHIRVTGPVGRSFAQLRYHGSYRGGRWA